VEVLIVVGIIGLLAAVLIPSLKTAKELSRSSLCASNMHQLQVGFSTARAQGQLGDPSYENLGWAPPGDPSWVSWAVSGVGEGGGVFLCPSDSGQAGSSTPSQGEGPSVKVVEVVEQLPPSLDAGAFTADDRAFLFPEQESIELGGTISVDAAEPGTYSGKQGAPGGSVPAGTRVSCWLLHWDSVARSDSFLDVTVSFGGEVLGVIYTTGRLNATDSSLGQEIVYPRGYYRGFDSEDDVLKLSSDRTRIDFSLQTVGYTEQVRILTRPGKAAYSSYGVNNQVTSSPPARQAVLSDYGKLVIDMDDSDGSIDSEKHRRLRHLDKANVLFGDGSVRAVGDEAFFQSDADHWSGR
jgi:prepilin-type processing-associated H-X9-DG protein